jgi:hypothetical protein
MSIRFITNEEPYKHAVEPIKNTSSFVLINIPHYYKAPAYPKINGGFRGLAVVPK